MAWKQVQLLILRGVLCCSIDLSGADDYSGDVSAARRSGGLARDLDLLQALAASPRGEGLGVMQLSELVDRDKSQVSRAMRALEAAGLVERDLRTLRYRLGTEFLVLAANAGPSRLLQLAPHHLHGLAEEIDETVHLCVLAGTGVITVASAAANSHAFRASGWEGRVVPAHCTSAGRVLLSDADLAFVEHRFANAEFDSAGPKAKVRDPQSLWSAIVAARHLGYAVVDEEFEAGLIGASAPVRDHHGRIVAAINVSARRDSSDGVAANGAAERRLHDLGRACLAAANELSRALGCPDDLTGPTGPS